MEAVAKCEQEPGHSLKGQARISPAPLSGALLPAPWLPAARTGLRPSRLMALCPWGGLFSCRCCAKDPRADAEGFSLRHVPAQ